MKVDHIAIQVDNPRDAANWYVNNFDAELLYVDDTWGFVEFENIKLAFVVKNQHPAHFAFKVATFSDKKAVKKHKDGTESCYGRDPWGNIYELIRYPDEQE